MITRLHGKNNETQINTDGPFTIIGEKINPTGSKRVAKALTDHDIEAIIHLARRQVDAGAAVLDINVGFRNLDEGSLLPEIIQAITDQIDIPICIDTSNPKALDAALQVVPGKALINSVTGEKSSMGEIIPMAKSYGAAIIGLVMDDDGIPETSQARLEVAEKIINSASREGIPADDIVIDPLVMAVATDSNAVQITTQTIQLVRQKLGVNINLGASNVSFGLPERKLLNQVFLAMAMYSGASCAITDPFHMTGTIKASDLMMGHDPFAGEYMQYCRAVNA